MGGGFHGATVITLDAKGRVAIPTRHRDALLDGGKSLVVTAHPDGCVLIYPANEWEPVRLRVEAFPSFHPQASWWKRLLLGFEEHLTPDGPARPSWLRARAWRAAAKPAKVKPGPSRRASGAPQNRAAAASTNWLGDESSEKPRRAAAPAPTRLPGKSARSRPDAR